MPGRQMMATRVQAYLTDPRVIAALIREAKAANIPLSQAAGRSLAKGLARSIPAIPKTGFYSLIGRFAIICDPPRATFKSSRNC